MDLKNIWTSNLQEAGELLDKCLNNEDFLKTVQDFSKSLVECFQSEGNLLVCGNGGSHCDALHFSEELTGRYRKDRSPLGAVALGEASHVTCVSNDYGFEHIFSRQVEGLGRSGDVFVGITTSGNSENVLNAVKAAKKKGLKTIALTGKSGGKIKDMADLSIIVPSNVTDRIQEVHIKIIHTVIQSVERSLFPENYQ